MKIRISFTSLFVMAGLLFFSCSSIPKGVDAVKGFEIERYLGQWYEIARTDNKFERDLDNVTANYTQAEDGRINVLNRGYNYVEGTWDSAEGIAKFRGSSDVAELKVSFFGPFYSGYNVVALDDAYQYALVMGRNLDYLWILSRTTGIPDAVRDDYLALADDIGYDTSALIWVNHDKAEKDER